MSEFTATAVFKLGFAYLRGLAVDEKAAVEILRPLANSGHPPSQYYIGRCYDEGTGMARDLVRAYQWYRKAADNGVANAQYRLGMCYYEGRGVPYVHHGHAYQAFMSAAQQCHPHGLFMVGMCHYKGRGVPQSTPEAIDWITRAADRGLMVACFYLANILADQALEEAALTDVPLKKGLERKALAYYRHAADMGMKAAHQRLADWYAQNRGGLLQDDPQRQTHLDYVHDKDARHKRPHDDEAHGLALSKASLFNVGSL